VEALVRLELQELLGHLGLQELQVLVEAPVHLELRELLAQLDLKE